MEICRNKCESVNTSNINMINISMTAAKPSLLFHPIGLIVIDCFCRVDGTIVVDIRRNIEETIIEFESIVGDNDDDDGGGSGGNSI